MLLEALLIKIRGTLDLAIVVGCIFCIFIDLEGALAAGRHVSAHESCSVLLELGAL